MGTCAGVSSRIPFRVVLACPHASSTPLCPYSNFPTEATLRAVPPPLGPARKVPWGWDCCLLSNNAGGGTTAMLQAPGDGCLCFPSMLCS